jgi:3D (Asp-Asp-Asp) domain-containing protein
VGEALRESGLALFAADFLDPPAETRIAAGMLISVTNAATLQVSADGTVQPLLTLDPRLGPAMADAGIPLQGLDLASPSETQLAADLREAHLTRVTESVQLSQEPVPFDNQTTDSADLELGIEQVLQPGLPGLAVASTRIRREDGTQVSSETSPQTVVVEPQDRLVVRGTKLVEKTETVDGVSITYWRSLQMYATVYSPCNSGTADGSCSSGTASGRPAGKGVVAVDPGLYAYLNGQRLYIPGYGFAVVGDIGGGYIIEQNLGISRYKWIDLGFDDNNIEDLTGWVPVYFLAPAPASVPDVLK